MEIPVRMPETRTDALNWESSLGLFSFGQSTSGSEDPLLNCRGAHFDAPKACGQPIRRVDPVVRRRHVNHHP